MIQMFNKSVLLIALSLFGTTMVVADSENENIELAKKSAYYFAELYAKTCMAYADDFSVLQDRFGEGKVPSLSKKKAKKFLDNKPGKVWVIPNVYGDFLVSINKQQQCVVYSRFLNINQVERAFIAQLEKTVSPLIFQKVQDETLPMKEGPAHFIRYVITNTDDDTKKNYVLTTSKADGVDIQIKASVSTIL